MDKRAVSAMLASHLLVCWVAVVLRIDRFPLTWVPMYSVYRSEDEFVYKVTYHDKTWLWEKGWLATRRDGTTEWLSRRAANLPHRTMRRLYYQRTRGGAPPRYRHTNHDANTLDRWLWGLEPGEPYVEIDWQRRLLVAVNKTWGRRPSDPDFIVSLEARAERFVFDRESLEFLGVEPRRSVAVWDEAWRADFP